MNEKIKAILAANEKALEGFQSNSVHSPVTPWLPCPRCKGDGIVGDDQYNEDCGYCEGTGEVSIHQYDAYIEFKIEMEWV